MAVCIKTIFVGKETVGKTSICKSILFGPTKYSNNEYSTIGACFFSKSIDNIKLDIWDTAGQERYNSLLQLYIRGAHIAILVYDMSDYKVSCNTVVNNIKTISNTQPNVKYIIVGNKLDLIDNKDINNIKTYVDNAVGSNDDIIASIYVSAKQYTNIDLLLSIISKHAKEMAKYIEGMHKKLEKPIILRNSKPYSIFSWCW